MVYSEICSILVQGKDNSWLILVVLQAMLTKRKVKARMKLHDDQDTGKRRRGEKSWKVGSLVIPGGIREPVNGK